MAALFLGGNCAATFPGPLMPGRDRGASSFTGGSAAGKRPKNPLDVRQAKLLPWARDDNMVCRRGLTLPSNK